MRLNYFTAILGFATLLQAKAVERRFAFYGKEVSVDVDQRLQTLQINTSMLDQKHIGSYTQQMQKMGLSTTLTQLKTTCDRLLLDDVGYFQMLKVLSMQGFPNQTPAFRIMLVWYGLRNAGYDALLTGGKKYVNVFVRLNQETDGGFEMKYRGLTYVSATADKVPYSELEIFNVPQFRDSATRCINFEMKELPELGDDIETKTRSFTYKDKNFDLQARYNRNLVDFMNDLPRFRVGTHLYHVQPSADAEQSIDDSMEVWLQHMTREEKLSFILALTQKAFPYRADAEYRKHEKRNFIEQTLADDYTDCEDKAAIFCYLVEKYLGDKTILLYSKSATHVTAAIELNATAPGYTFKIGKTPYLVCEAACNGYKPGQSLLSLREIQESEIFY